jgi:hypothetical protein
VNVTITILETSFDVEYDFDITASGSPASWSAYGGDPAEPAEWEVDILSLALSSKPDEMLEIPKWLDALIADHLYERPDINEIVQRADQERGSYDYDE